MLSIVILLFGSHEYILFNFDCVSISIQKKATTSSALLYFIFTCCDTQLFHPKS